MINSLNFSQIESLGKECGLQIVAVTAPEPLVEEAKRLKRWQEAGHAGEMQWMTRDPHLFVEPSKFLEGVRSIIFVCAYYSQAPKPPCPSGYGRIARYAWGKDYHHVLKDRLEHFAEVIKKEIGSEIKYRTFSDAVPFLERAFAERAGLGFRGKHTLLIRPKQGSFFFIGEIFLDVEIRGMQPIATQSLCGSCTKCLDTCPTGAIISPYQLDARRCISYLTIEKRGVIPHGERALLGDWIFGCDICQDVCPFNHTPLKTQSTQSLLEFNANEGVGPLLSLKEILSIRTDDTFKKRFERTAILRTKREGLVRNACIVASNTKATIVKDTLIEALKDFNPVIRAHAFGAMAQLHREGVLYSAKEFACYKDTVYRDINDVRTELEYLQ